MVVEEEISSRSSYTKLKLKKVQQKMIVKIFFVTIATFLTITTFTAIFSNVSEVDAATVVDPECGVVDQNPSGECDIDVDYDGNCSPSATNCDIDINVDANPLPRGNNELRLNYLLETGIECNNVPNSFKAQCLLNTQNDYISTTTIDTDGQAQRFDNQFNFEGKQQILDTAGQDNFIATNDMTQNVRVNTIGPNSVVDTDGDGDNVQLEYLQEIREPDDTRNTNIANQLVSLEATGEGTIDTSEHSELGFRVEQRLIDNDDEDSKSPQTTSAITAINRANQILGIDSDNSARITYDTAGLSTITQLIEDCSFSTGTTTCTNQAGDPTTTNTGQVVQLTANGAGTTINVDDLRQLINQNIDDFRNSNGATPTNNVNLQLFKAVANTDGTDGGGDIDMDIPGVTQTQSITQSILGSGENGNPSNLASMQLNVGTDGIPIVGDVKTDVDQTLTQTIRDVDSGGSGNNGQELLTLLAKDGPSQLFIEGFNQYLIQTVDGCSGCSNAGIVSALFEVEDTSTFTLKDGSFQGLTQTVNQNGASNNNAIYSQIYVSGAGTTANIGVYFQISNMNGANNGVASFTGTYSGGLTYNQNCIITSVGAYTQDSPGICY